MTFWDDVMELCRVVSSFGHEFTLFFTARLVVASYICMYSRMSPDAPFP